MLKREYQKKIISIITIVLLVFQLLSNVIIVQAVSEDDYSINQNGELVVTINNINAHSNKITIPSTINGITVKKIARVFNTTGASIKEIELPETVEEIGDSAFEEIRLKKVNIPRGVKEIGKDAFLNNYLTEIDVSCEVTEIKEGAFGNNPWKEINIGNTVKVIGNGAFQAPVDLSNIGEYSIATSIKTLSIPDSVEQIGDGAFQRLPLEEIDLGNSVKTIGSGAFYECEITELDIPDSVTKIGNGAFQNRVVYNNGVAVEYGGKLKKVKLSNSLEEIGLSAFSGNQLTILEIPDSVKTIGDGAFAYNKIESLQLPNQLKTIGDGAFAGNQLTQVTFPDSLEIIEDQAFSANKLTSVDIPKNVKTIGTRAFSGNQIVSVRFANLIEIIGDEAFIGNKISELKIPSSVKYIGAKAFTKNQIKDLKIGLTATAILQGEEKEINIPSELETIGEYAFSDNQIESVDIPSSIKTLGAYSFSNNNLTHIDIPTSIEVLEPGVFQNNKLTEVNIPDSIKSIGELSFLNNNITNVEFGNSVERIGGAAFRNNKLAVVKFPETLRVIEKYAFSDNNIKILEIPEHVAELQEKSFQSNSNIDYVIFLGRTVRIADDAFMNSNISKIRGYNGSTAKKFAINNGIEFIKLDDGSGYIWDEDNYNFNNSGTYFSSYDIGNFVYNINYACYQYYVDNFASLPWGGSCIGLAETNLLFKYGYLTKENWQVAQYASNCVHDLLNVAANQRLLWVINFYQVFQGPLASRHENIDVVGMGEIEGFVEGLNRYYAQENVDEYLLCTYFWESYDGISGHAIVITGAPEALEGDTYYSEYSYRIPVYDTNYMEPTYIYIRRDLTNIALGTESEVRELSTVFGNTAENAAVTQINALKLNRQNVFNLEEVERNGQEVNLNTEWFENDAYQTAFMQLDADSNVKVQNQEGQYAIIKDGKKIDGELECKLTPIMANEIESTSKIENNVIALKNEDYYTVENEDETKQLDAQVLFGDSYMKAKTTGKAQATFENKKSVNVVSESGNDYEVAITLNKEFSFLPWYTITAMGSDAKNIKLEMTEQGAVVTGDNLNNLKIIGNNMQESKKVDASTDGKAILIKANADNKEMYVYVDKDGDGKFEELLNTSEEKGKDINNAQTGDGIDYALICLFVSFMILIFMEFIRCIRL